MEILVGQGKKRKGNTNKLRLDHDYLRLLPGHLHEISIVGSMKLNGSGANSLRTLERGADSFDVIRFGECYHGAETNAPMNFEEP